jgi:hypothetical protein
MAFCPPEMLDDLADVLDEVRAWERVVERKPGVFYVGREPFLHFHLLAGARRRGDVKGASDWVQLDLPRPLPTTVRRAFVRALRRSYGEKGVRARPPARS